nr:MAG TPA: hypothetical protein [Caudoviricetes sp.]
MNNLIRVFITGRKIIMVYTIDTRTGEIIAISFEA